MQYKHPNPELNAQLIKLQDRYIKLFHVLHSITNGEADNDDKDCHGNNYDNEFNEDTETEKKKEEAEKNARLLQKIGMAIQQIIHSADVQS